MIRLKFSNHISLNQIKNIDVRAIAVSNQGGRANFSVSAPEKGALAPDGDLEVSVATLDELGLSNCLISLVKIDVEGAESKVLEGGQCFFKIHKPVILLATHSQAQENNCRAILENYNYSMQPLSQDLYGSGCNEWLVKPQEKVL